MSLSSPVAVSNVGEYVSAERLCSYGHHVGLTGQKARTWDCPGMFRRQAGRLQISSAFPLKSRSLLIKLTVLGAYSSVMLFFRRECRLSLHQDDTEKPTGVERRCRESGAELC